MITKEQYIKNLTQEIDIIRHLGTKITPEMTAYRPHEKQRTLLELMGYLGQIFGNATTAIIAGSTANFRELVEASPKVTFENFDSIMAEQESVVRAKLEALTEAELSEEVEIFYNRSSRAMHFMAILKWAAAYKMQLFLYIKATGNHDIKTSNLWHGTDPAPMA